MKKMLLTLTVLASAFCAMTFTACGDKAADNAATENKEAADKGKTDDANAKKEGEQAKPAEGEQAKPTEGEQGK